MGGLIKRLSPIVVLGDRSQQGSYLLRITVTETLNFSFGRFKKGCVIAIPTGDCVYVGSALANKGAMSLGRRVVRHATRTGQQSPHPVRPQLLEKCKAIGLGEGNLLPKNGKKPFWNIDYLLDQPVVNLTHIILIRSPTRLEARLGQLLEGDPHTFILEKGLGANDVPGNTHLLGVRADELWWASLPEKISQLLSS